MDDKDYGEYVVVPKLLGLIVDARTGKIAGWIDASSLLAPESREALTETLGAVVSRIRTEADRKKLERLYLLPARDLETRTYQTDREQGEEA